MNSPLDFRLPNIRKMFIPDPGYTILDIDQRGADAQVVAWEADDAQLKEAFRAGLKIHAVNAKDLFGNNAGPDGKREPYYTRAKSGVHLTNYGGKARTLAATLGLTVHEAEWFQRRWFELHPGVRDWHNRVRAQLQAERSVRNAFGYRRFYFERIDDRTLNQALAWIPQSTVAIVTNRAWTNIDEQLDPLVQVLLQVHDSLVLQTPTSRLAEAKRKLLPLIQIPVPYPDPLTIPWGIKSSGVSWGDCQDDSWE
jgi:DNA polymerase-1